MANARLVAVNALFKINKEKAYSNLTLDKLFSSADLSPKDKALATALVYGVLDRKITIDYIISKLSKTPLKKLSPLTVEAIRIGIYQLMFMERIPESAAVNESVNIIKRSKESRNSGFVNAILRNFIRNPIELPKGDDIHSLSVRFSCPEWIIKGFLDDYGTKDTVKLLEASLLSPPVILRVNTLKTTTEQLLELLKDEGITAKHTDIKDALEIEGGIDIKNSKLYRDGYFFVQDTASQTVVKILSPKPNEKVLDICSAPGGKTFTTALLMENKGEITACDLYEQRLCLVKRSAERLGLDIIKTKVNDATKVNKEFKDFDAVLCDVPCSGLGALRRKPEIKYKEITDFSEIEAIGRTILQNAVCYLKKGGRILYSTCTLRKAENENVVAEFLEKNKNFKLSCSHTFMPHLDNTDGFFCALLENID
ncbi:MAG: 16S rRNA (cytosine(967)-C(5))-methyltransferase RsmB [Ruminococcaceae bacterium]|nr:16S rRNA (cytosine(967)-C(5))-methyltransferase RsmB [Oscillospiraceae bacterium]